MYRNRTALVRQLVAQHTKREANNLPTGGPKSPTILQVKLLSGLGTNPAEYRMGFPTITAVNAYVTNKKTWADNFKRKIHDSGPATCKNIPVFAMYTPYTNSFNEFNNAGEQKQVLMALAVPFEDDKLSRAEGYDLVTKMTSGIKVLTFHELHFRHGVDVDVLKTLSAETVKKYTTRIPARFAKTYFQTSCRQPPYCTNWIPASWKEKTWNN